ncbi:hypothetical protein ACH4UR_01880 [Streptomyces lydicus]|uniref:hypothetical protein n=1 Tax=Streptomyces lydicus TaxID=47763 RepID=UPI0033EDC1D3
MAINYQGVDNMTNATTSFLILLLRWLLPTRGCHRTGRALPEARCVDMPTLALPRVPAREPEVLCGEDSVLVRPYLLTPAELHARRSQHQRRQAPWLALDCIDVGPHEAQAVKAAA